MTARYLENLSTAGLADYRSQLTAVSAPETAAPAAADHRQGDLTLRLSGGAEYLSEVFGIAQPDAHRAWCDAQANALLYGKLKELAR